MYFATVTGEPFVKIGYSTNVKGRIEAGQAWNWKEVQLIGYMPGTRQTERELHLRWRRFRVRREWFFLSDEVRHGIADLLEDNGVKE